LHCLRLSQNYCGQTKEQRAQTSVSVESKMAEVRNEDITSRVEFTAAT
jgi:hypothetical protein